jgi:hypothetical protein
MHPPLAQPTVFFGPSHHSAFTPLPSRKFATIPVPSLPTFLQIDTTRAESLRHHPAPQLPPSHPAAPYWNSSSQSTYWNSSTEFAPRLHPPPTPPFDTGPASARPAPRITTPPRRRKNLPEGAQAAALRLFRRREQNRVAQRRFRERRLLEAIRPAGVPPAPQPPLDLDGSGARPVDGPESPPGS